MSRRQDAATATVGLSGVAGAAMLRHKALDSAYGRGTVRPRVLAERQLLRVRRGRGRYALGAALAAAAAPAAATGTSRLVNKAQQQDERSFVAEGFRGARRAAETSRRRTPAETAATLGVGGAIGGAAGHLTHRALGRTPVPRTLRAGAAAASGVLAGAATLPLQNRVLRRASHGRYEATPTGIRRRRSKPVPASAKAGRNAVAKADPGASMSRSERRARITAAGPPVPVVGDLMQAGMAARLAPAGRRHRVAAQQYGSNVVGGTAGTAAGALGLAAASNRNAKVRARTKQVNDRIDDVKRRVNIDPHKPSMTARALSHERTPGGVRRAVAAAGKSRAGRLLARNAPAAAVGGLLGGAVGGQIASQAAITRQLRVDDRYRKDSRHGGRSRISKAESAPPPPTKRERKELGRRKEISAGMSMIGGATGLGALGATLGAKGLKRYKAVPRVAAVRRRLKKAPVPLLTTGAGVGGVNAFNYADIQHREAKQAQAVRKGLILEPTGRNIFGKAIGIPRPRVPRAPSLAPTGRRVPSFRQGFVRQTRTATGIKTSTVRGGLSR